MYKAAEYVKTNANQRRHVKEVIQELQVHFNWQENTGGTLLDIGCGPGDITVDLVLPLLGKNYGKIVGSDASEAMVQHATEAFSFKERRIQFQIMDISEENLQIVEQFDHVTSFFCLNWMQDRQRLAIKNIFNLTKPGGDTMFMFSARGAFCTTFENLSKTVKWSKYLTNVHRFTFSQQHSENPVEEFKSMLEEAGFQQIYCRTKEIMFTYDGFEEFRESFTAINIFESDIPISLHDEFYLEYFEEIGKIRGVFIESGNNGSIGLPLTLLIAYAKKPVMELTTSRC